LPAFVLAVIVSSFASAAAWGQGCPRPLTEAHRLVLVTADDMNSATGRLQRFTRAHANAAWRPDGGPRSALVGFTGMAWGYSFRSLAHAGEPLKAEGDKRTPAGFYRIGRGFGFAASPQPNYLQIREGTVCVDDPRSAAYNTITSRAQVGQQVHGENMWRVARYRHGLLIDYPTSRQARGGSCIFIHLWPTGATGTNGCVALPEPQLLALQSFAESGAVLAVLPRQALGRFKGCLPEMIPDGRVQRFN
jgi:D-alanyl-D-alanine dipeptidase